MHNPCSEMQSQTKPFLPMTLQTQVMLASKAGNDARLPSDTILQRGWKGTPPRAASSLDGGSITAACPNRGITVAASVRDGSCVVAASFLVGSTTVAAWFKIKASPLQLHGERAIHSMAANSQTQMEVTRCLAPVAHPLPRGPRFPPGNNLADAAEIRQPP